MPALVRQYFDETYDVEYSLPSCRRLLKEAGLSYQRPRRTAAEADEDEQEEFHDKLKKAAGDGRHSSLYRPNQEILQVEPRAAWFPRGMRPNVELSGQRDWTCLLGAITEDGDRFFSRFGEYVTNEHAEYIIFTLWKEIKDDPIIVLDGAPYFQVSAVTDLVARDDLAFIPLPVYSSELNPVEECWRQIQSALSNRFFDSLSELTTPIDTTLHQLSISTVSNHL